MSGARKGKGLALMGMSLAMLALAFVLPWYHLTSTIHLTAMGDAVSYEHRFYLMGWTREVADMNVIVTGEYGGDLNAWEALGEVMLVELTLLLLAAALTVGGVTTVLLRRRAPSFYLCHSAAIVLVVMPVFFFLFAPMALAGSLMSQDGVSSFESFWGTQDVLAYTYSWGPMMSWYLVIVCAAMQVAASELISPPAQTGPGIQ